MVETTREPEIVGVDDIYCKYCKYFYQDLSILGSNCTPSICQYLEWPL